jgi:hypothetical protein
MKVISGLRESFVNLYAGDKKAPLVTLISLMSAYHLYLTLLIAYTDRKAQ